MAKKVISRRSIIKSTSIAGAGLCNLSFFSKNIIESIFNQAMAQNMGIIDTKYFFIQQSGAPPRWFFDGALHPDGDKSKFIVAPQVGTKFTGGARYDGLEYATTKVQGLDMPWLWQYTIPRPGGGFVPMSNLAADGMLSIRGANTMNPAHAAAQGLQSRPLGIPHTLNALSSDVSGLPIGAVDVSSSRFQYSSTKGLSSVRISNSGNMIENLMKPFIKANLGTFESDSQKVAAALKSTRSALDKMAKDKHPGAEIVANSTESAIELFSRDFGDLDVAFDTLKAKYRDLVARAIAPGRSLVGMTDKPIGNSGTRTDHYKFGNKRAMNADLRDMITTNTNANRMADQFALAEFTLINNISSSVTIAPSVLRSLGTENANTSQFHDEHSAGRMTSLLINTHYYLALTSCMYEIIQQLKAMGAWDKTVMRLDGEFGRCPKNNGFGSDHSAEGNVISLYSGKLNGLSVIGNITSNGGRGRDGTWGFGAAVDGYGGLTLGHTTSTLAHLLGVSSPVTAVGTLLREEGGKLVPLIPTGKII